MMSKCCSGQLCELKQEKEITTEREEQGRKEGTRPGLGDCYASPATKGPLAVPTLFGVP